MRPRLSLFLAAVTALGAAGVAVAAPPQPGHRPVVVVAVADTGVNPYHAIYRRPKNTAHPCTYVQGFTDCSIPALRLSLGKHKDYAAAVEADRDVWASVRPGQWYWIPGTNIIGAVCSPERGGTETRVAVADATCILDDDGHGTSSTSSVLSEAPDALLLVHDGTSAADQLATAPVLADVRSHSWGPRVPMPLQATHGVAAFDLCSQTVRRRESLFFLAAGNEAPFPAIADCARQRPDVHIVGGAYPGHWTPQSWSMYDFASWMCRPTALHDSLDGFDDVSCGTSFAAPTAAGAAAAALHRLRVADGYTGRSTATHVSRTVTRPQFEAALRRAASYDPKPKYAVPLEECDYLVCYLERNGLPLPAQAPWLFWGYGWLDSTVTDTVVSCVRGRGCPGKPAQAQEWNDRRQQLRAGTSPQVLPPMPPDDAGSRREAGRTRADAVPVLAGRTYSARLSPAAFGDEHDAFVISVRKGQRITVSADVVVGPPVSRPGVVPVPEAAEPQVGCWVLRDPDDRILTGHGDAVAVFAHGCDHTQPHAPPKDVVAPATGAYLLSYSTRDGALVQDYRFTVSLTG